MRGTGKVRMSARAERRAIVALFATFALLVQALMPMAAAASTGVAGDKICSAHGVHVAPADHAPAKGTPTSGCEHGCCPAAFTATPNEALQVAETIAFPAVAPRLIPREGPAPGRGLAAPPPPSQGPPRFSA
jgi:hypothetical protein